MSISLSIIYGWHILIINLTFFHVYGIISLKGADMMYKVTDLFDLTHTIAKEYLEGYEYPWDALGGI